MNVAFAALLAAVLAFGTSVVVGGNAISNSLRTDCQALNAFQWSGEVYDCRTRPSTQTEQERS